jgi:hypothetical protein
LNSLSKKEKNPTDKWGVLKAQELALGVNKLLRKLSIYCQVAKDTSFSGHL